MKVLIKMKRKQLQKLINSNKRILTITRPIKFIFKCDLISFNGKGISKQYKELRSDLKNDIHIIFKPVKVFTKNSLKGLD